MRGTAGTAGADGRGREPAAGREDAEGRGQGAGAGEGRGRGADARGAVGGFMARQEALLVRQGRANAAAASRRAVEYCDGEGAGGDAGEGEGEEDGWDGGSVASTASRAPSLHPSLGGRSMSLGLSGSTLGAGDETQYWAVAHRSVARGDLGHTCRECREPFTQLGEPLTERRGARTSARYHALCFSGFADPRSQAGSSMHLGRLAGTQLEAAPRHRAAGRMKTGTHFEGPGLPGIRVEPPAPPP